MSMQSLDIKRLSATTTTPPQVREPRSGEIAKLIDVSKCIGCKACQSACMEWNDLRPDIVETPFGPEVVSTTNGTYNNPTDLNGNTWTVMRFTEYENEATGNLEWLIRKDGCMHCAEPGCLKACPSPGAIVQYTNGIVDFHEEKCIGCGYCITGCPFNIPRISKKDNKAYKCTMCSDRVAVGLEPACVKTCPTGAIVFGTKEAMKDHAETRIADLKRRGFENAGLYDPEGVGGTHVMYVLHHADKPSIYANLPEKPQISPMVTVWKGVAKPLAMVAMGAAMLGSLFHFITKGPNSVSKELEDEMDAEDRELARQAAAGIVRCPTRQGGLIHATQPTRHRSLQRFRAAQPLDRRLFLHRSGAHGAGDVPSGLLPAHPALWWRPVDADPASVLRCRHGVLLHHHGGALLEAQLHREA